MMCRTKKAFKAAIEKVMVEKIDRLAEQIDQEYQAMGIPKADKTRQENKATRRGTRWLSNPEKQKCPDK